MLRFPPSEKESCTQLDAHRMSETGVSSAKPKGPGSNDQVNSPRQALRDSVGGGRTERPIVRKEGDNSHKGYPVTHHPESVAAACKKVPNLRLSEGKEKRKDAPLSPTSATTSTTTTTTTAPHRYPLSARSASEIKKQATDGGEAGGKLGALNFMTRRKSSLSPRRRRKDGDEEDDNSHNNDNSSNKMVVTQNPIHVPSPTTTTTSPRARKTSLNSSPLTTSHSPRAQHATMTPATVFAMRHSANAVVPRLSLSPQRGGSALPSLSARDTPGTPPQSTSPKSNNNNTTTTPNHHTCHKVVSGQRYFSRPRTTSLSLYTSRKNVDAVLDLPMRFDGGKKDVDNPGVMPLPPIESAKLPPPIASAKLPPPIASAKLPPPLVGSSMSFMHLSADEIATPRIHYPSSPQQPLHHSPPLSPTSPLSASAPNLGEDPSSLEEKQKRMRHKAAMELVDTERDYAHDLGLVLNLFVKPLKVVSLDGPQSKLKDLTSNLAILASVSRKILKHFDTASPEEKESMMVGTVYLSMMQYFRLYNVYCTVHESVVKIIETEIKENQEFASFVQECMNDPQWKRLNLFSYLIKPVQRITKYPLLFKAVLAHTPKSHPDYPALKKARKEMKEVVHFINEAKRVAEAKQKVIELWEAIDDDGGEVPAFAPFRRILTEVDVRVIIEKGKPRRRRCILCNDVLLYLKAKKNGRFSSPAYRTLANLAACDIWDNGTGEAQNGFMLVDLHTRAKDTLIFPDATKKEQHLTKIREILDAEQRKRVRAQANRVTEEK